MFRPEVFRHVAPPCHVMQCRLVQQSTVMQCHLAKQSYVMQRRNVTRWRIMFRTVALNRDATGCRWAEIRIVAVERYVMRCRCVKSCVVAMSSNVSTCIAAPYCPVPYCCVAM